MSYDYRDEISNWILDDISKITDKYNAFSKNSCMEVHFKTIDDYLKVINTKHIGTIVAKDDEKLMIIYSVEWD